MSNHDHPCPHCGEDMRTTHEAEDCPMRPGAPAVTYITAEERMREVSESVAVTRAELLEVLRTLGGPDAAFCVRKFNRKWGLS